MVKAVKFTALIIAMFSAVMLFAGDQAKIGEKAPAFTLTDTHGKTHSLADFKGKYVVLEWINFDCPFVVKHYESKNMQNLQKKYTGKDVVWLTICSSGEGKQGHYDNNTINEKLKERGASMTAYLIDEDGTVGKKYMAKTTPHMYIISPEGNLIFAGGIDNIKSTDTDDIKKSKNWVQIGLDEAMSGKEITEKTPTPYGCSVKYK